MLLIGIAAWSRIGLTADGAQHLARILDQGPFVLWDPARAGAFLLIQAPLRLLLLAGPASRDTAMALYSATLVALPLLALLAATCLAWHSRPLRALVLAIAAGFTVPLFSYAVSEVNLLVALALVVAAVALRPTASPRGDALALLAALILLRVHEGGVILLATLFLAVLVSLFRPLGPIPPAARRIRIATAHVLLAATLLALHAVLIIETDTPWRSAVVDDLPSHVADLRYRRFAMVLIAATVLALLPAPGVALAVARATAFAACIALAVWYGLLNPVPRVQTELRLFGLVGVPPLLLAALAAAHIAPASWARIGRGPTMSMVALLATVTCVWFLHTATLWHDYVARLDIEINTATADIPLEASVLTRAGPLHAFRPIWSLRPLAVLLRRPHQSFQYYLLLSPDDDTPFPLANREPFPGLAQHPRR
jgi:hypothetical protein